MLYIAANSLITHGRKDRSDGRKVGSSSCFALERNLCLLLGVKGLFLDFSLCLEFLNQISISPSYFLRQSTQESEVAVGAHAQYLQGIRHNNTLLLVIRLRDSLVSLFSRKMQLCHCHAHCPYFEVIDAKLSELLTIETMMLLTARRPSASCPRTVLCGSMPRSYQYQF